VTIVKRILRAVWRAVRPLREALAARFDQHLDRHFENWLVRVERVGSDQKHAIADMQLVADTLIRELVRLQTQVQRLQEAVEQSTDVEGVEKPAVRRLAA
jgi:hypothetical protein